jgi:hypothetical protein
MIVNNIISVPAVRSEMRAFSGRREQSDAEAAVCSSPARDLSATSLVKKTAKEMLPALNI